jgi:hypothetical protein
MYGICGPCKWRVRGRSKKNFIISTNLDEAALARKDLVEKSNVLEIHRNDLITHACLRIPFQAIGTSPRNQDQTFDFRLQRHRAGATSILQMEWPQSAFTSKITGP